MATTWTFPDGKTCRGWTWPLDLNPPVPPGAVRADPRRQLLSNWAPRYWYEDEARTCVQCGAAFVFSGAEQRFWYETLQFPFESTAVRCVACRRRRRTQQARHRAVADARAAVAASPEDPVSQFALADALVSLHETTGQGSLDDAIAAARKAHGGDAVHAAVVWEARAQHLAGRDARARDLLAPFLAGKTPGRKAGAVVRSAWALWEQLGGGDVGAYVGR
ncbi:MAG: zinc-ribbon domain containing protein [Alphaproteobacteria bacterium]|nr:zinc-ribbon domain containing protein [Alphaproteobacteria bacterium]